MPLRVRFVRAIWRAAARAAARALRRSRRLVDTRVVTEKLPIVVSSQSAGRMSVVASTPTVPRSVPRWLFHSPIARWTAAIGTCRSLGAPSPRPTPSVSSADSACR